MQHRINIYLKISLITIIPLCQDIFIPEATRIQNELRTDLDITEHELKITTIGGADFIKPIAKGELKEGY